LVGGLRGFALVKKSGTTAQRLR